MSVKSFQDTFLGHLTHQLKMSHEAYLDNLDWFKKQVDKTPNKFLQFHLDNAVRDEHYELADYIKKRMERQGLIINQKDIKLE